MRLVSSVPSLKRRKRTSSKSVSPRRAQKGRQEEDSSNNCDEDDSHSSLVRRMMMPLPLTNHPQHSHKKQKQQQPNDDEDTSSLSSMSLASSSASSSRRRSRRSAPDSSSLDLSPRAPSAQTLLSTPASSSALSPLTSKKPSGSSFSESSAAAIKNDSQGDAPDPATARLQAMQQRLQKEMEERKSRRRARRERLCISDDDEASQPSTALPSTPLPREPCVQASREDESTLMKRSHREKSLHLLKMREQQVSNLLTMERLVAKQVMQGVSTSPRRTPRQTPGIPKVRHQPTASLPPVVAPLLFDEWGRTKSDDVF